MTIEYGAWTQGQILIVLFLFLVAYVTYTALLRRVIK